MFWLTVVPAVFMTVVVTFCILVVPEGFNLPYAAGSVGFWFLIV
jgi:hypothetical protein